VKSEELVTCSKKGIKIPNTSSEFLKKHPVPPRKPMTKNEEVESRNAYSNLVKLKKKNTLLNR
jgi:hypothetical protein